MTSKNTNLKYSPFLLDPVGKDYLWGGDRLNTDFHKNISLSPLAETWECSTHPDGTSTVASGQHQGRLLSEVLAEHPEYLGSHPAAVLEGTRPSDLGRVQPSSLAHAQLPILIKLIDSKQDLSVQVHPDDAYALQKENGSLGKTEMWYVLDAKPGAKLIYGFNRDMTPELLQRGLEQGRLKQYLQQIPVQKDDVFLIESGTVHAIGAGVLLAEVQENSNLTYRLFDYNRRDKNGNTRPLHISKAMEVLNYKASDRPRQPMRTLRYRPGCAAELLCRCKYFQVERLLINTEYCSQLPDCSTENNSFQVLLCVDGAGILWEHNDEPLCEEDAKKIPFSKGSCIFLPANSTQLKLQGNAQILKVSC